MLATFHQPIIHVILADCINFLNKIIIFVIMVIFTSIFIMTGPEIFVKGISNHMDVII